MNLSGRLSLGFVLLALLAMGLPGALLWRDASRRVDELEKARHGGLERWLESRWLELEGEVGEQAAGLAADSGVPGGGGLAVTTPELAWVLDGDGVILACPHWPARVGRPAPDLRAVQPGQTRVMRRQIGNQAGPVMVSAAAVTQDAAGKLALAGVRLDDLAARLGMEWQGDAQLHTAILDQGGKRLTWSGSGTAWPLEGWAPAPDAHGWQQAQGARGSLSVLLRPLTGAAGERWMLAVATRRSPLENWRRGLLAAVVVSTTAAVLLAGCGGILLGRRLLLPVRELIASTEIIAHGRQELTLPVRSHDEVGRLTEAFNRMAEAVSRSRSDLAASARLAAWRDAARRMAHEVKNPLAPIRLAVENLRRAREVAPDRFPALFAEECRTILEEVDALSRLVDSFARFARLPEPHLQPGSVEDLLRRVEGYATGHAGIHLQTMVEERLPPVPMDTDLMGQVLKNLVVNALDAVPANGGRIQIRARLAGEELCLEVEDNGPGVPEALRVRIFEPQVTTKSGGAGLGLAICRQIVDSHGGRMDVETGAGGTTFRVWLPLNTFGSEHGAHSHR